MQNKDVIKALLTNENKVEVGAGRIDGGLLDSTAGEGTSRSRNQRAISLLLQKAAGKEPSLHIDLDF